jgi:hypothetical protein
MKLQKIGLIVSIASLLFSAFPSALATADDDPVVVRRSVHLRYTSGTEWEATFAGGLRRHKSGTYSIAGMLRGKCLNSSGKVKIEYGKTTESWKSSDYKYCDRQERFWDSPNYPISKGDLIEVHVCIVGIFSTGCGSKEVYHLWDE